ncbi:Putative protein [Zobellia galactanivorans]|uniref:Uncharacterized protein n=1 Tax=Zobellia galactanivorans (strain DSM 12802 / CCUG 47099 / CIP 106680 / NCIMB 13871 / Dsij) TaxID=63186 RepID=G0L8B6_ZOBGA|nr:Putative protein [Zobellia galactanivorans]
MPQKASRSFIFTLAVSIFYEGIPILSFGNSKRKNSYTTQALAQPW